MAVQQGNERCKLGQRNSISRGMGATSSSSCRSVVSVAGSSEFCELSTTARNPQSTRLRTAPAVSACHLPAETSLTRSAMTGGTDTQRNDRRRKDECVPPESTRCALARGLSQLERMPAMAVSATATTASFRASAPARAPSASLGSPPRFGPSDCWAHDGLRRRGRRGRGCPSVVVGAEGPRLEPQSTTRRTRRTRTRTTRSRHPSRRPPPTPCAPRAQFSFPTGQAERGAILSQEKYKGVNPDGSAQPIALIRMSRRAK